MIQDKKQNSSIEISEIIGTVFAIILPYLTAYIIFSIFKPVKHEAINERTISTYQETASKGSSNPTPNQTEPIHYQGYLRDREAERRIWSR